MLGRLVLAFYDCDEFVSKIKPLMTANVAALGYWDSYTGAFLIHCTVPAEFVDYWNGACYSYDCDTFYTDNSFSLPYLGGAVGHLDVGACRFHFHNLTHTNWDTGAFLMIVIGITRIFQVIQLHQLLLVVAWETHTVIVDFFFFFDTLILHMLVGKLVLAL